MFQLILLLLFTLADLSHQATSVEEAYVVGLFPEPVYEMVNTTGRDPNDQSIKITIQNMGSSANDVGYHAYLSDTAEALSFSMNTEGVSYRGKKVDHKEAREVFEKAKLEDHNAAVYIPRPLPVDRNSELQSESVNVHIKGEKKMTFNLEYTESIADKLASGEKVLNRAAVVLDMYGSTAENLFGEVYSPNYPNNYPNNADLAWWVRVPDDETVTLHVTDLDIEECCDRLTIYDGVSKNGQVISVLTGQLSNESIVIQTTTNSIYLHLASDCSFTSRGFAATVTMSGNTVPTYEPPSTTTDVYPTQPNVTACNGGDYLYSYSGSISSPNYPYSYYDNLYCSWHIRIPYYSYVVSMTVQDLHLQSYDYLRVYDGSSSYYPMIAQLTGVIHSNPTYYSSGTDMFLLLTTDSYGSTYSGFQLTYTYSYAQQTNNPTTESNDVTTASALPTACNGGDYIYSYSGYIYTPNYPGNYYNELSCSWQVRIPSTYYVVKLTVQAFQLEPNYDYLYVYDGSSSSYAQLASWTGNHTQGEALYSSSRDMFLQLYTDHSVTHQGFQLYFTNTYPQPGANIQACNGGEFLNSYSGSFTSPNYPSYYNNDLYCTWHIQMPSYSYAVNLTITDLQLQYSDYLYIYDGPSISYPLLTYLTGSYYYPLMYYSTGRDMYVRLSTSSSGQDNGFQAFYTYTYPQQPATTAAITTDQACNGGEYIYAYSGHIYSPNYPGNYYDYLDCSWQITIPYYYYVVKLTISDFNLENNYDYLKVYDGSSDNYALLTMWTGNVNSGEKVYSSSYHMFLQFHTDSSVSSNGFSLSFDYASPSEASGEGSG
uniref:deleted in malignant brain tumors 1 protein-like isoform X3 n=1 Tax=Ciona intestinalis TaxID=7719 RepID=UPI000EF4600A|nr:deleted in malignant brain tumors 1 protein-like isoform X3 [Ciona intestinalis]XP_026689845.1 deleted in malignant brain tumors 1 protein-like isoform X4 [Ciona intestinalis]|eukprot:XP_026689840.1 deleted in malignant brain tumors 1 protein-like isoform X3 [Ciona intestinalis]